jgi:hypothetical protein
MLLNYMIEIVTWLGYIKVRIIHEHVAVPSQCELDGARTGGAERE